MSIRVYRDDAEVFTIARPEDIARLVPDEEIADFVLDADDVAAWKAGEAITAVRAEAARRMRALVGARNDRHLDIKISNGLREAARLLRKEVDGETLTAEEAARKAALQQVDAGIEKVRAASNVLEAMSPVPGDYAADAHWPAAV